MTIVPMDQTVNALRAAFGDLPVSEFRGDTRVVVPAEKTYAVLELLKEKHGFDLLVDITCVDYLNYPGAKDRFGLVYLLANVETNQRIAVRCFVNDPEPAVPTVVPLWEGADWLEREVWDMSGVRFRGHPDMRRILMYPEFEGHPLQKTYPADRTQPLVAYRTEDEAGVPLNKLEPFGPDEGMPFGRAGSPRLEEN